MKKTFVIAVSIILLLSVVISAGMMIPRSDKANPNDKAKEHAKDSFALPSHAVEIAPGVFYLGKAIDKGRVVEGYAIVDYKKGHGKPTGCNNDGKCQGWENSSCADCAGNGNGEEESDTSSCYDFLAKGAKWKNVEPYIVNPSNDDGLNSTFIINNLASDIDKWEDAAGVDILGEGISTTETLVADFKAPDEKNEVYFADIGEPNTIAFAVVWGIFRGPPPFRELVEWDMVFNDYYNWGDAKFNSTLMDFENIATHELGHAVGLSDLYNTECSEQTMYGYSQEGDIEKRTLEDGDIAGIQSLY